MKTISFTGHIDLRPEDTEQIKNALYLKFEELKTKYSGFVLLTGNAKGGDELAIKVATDLGIEVKLLTEEVPKKQNEEDSAYYQRQGKYSITNANVLLALWDGVFNSKKGGTSDIVRMALDAQTGIEIYQLPVPRIKNAIPVVYSLGEVITNPFPFQWNLIKTNKKEKPKNSFAKLFSDIFNTQVFWIYILPILLLLLNLVSGFIGYWQLKPKDGFFKVLSTTIINFAENEAPNDALLVSKIAGIGVLICAFCYGFFVAMKSYRQNAKRWWWQIKGDFDILWGPTETLAKDLVSERPLIVISDKEILFEESKKFEALSVSPSIRFEDLYVEKASHIYLNLAKDSENIEKALEIEHYLDQKSIPNVIIQLNEEANIIYAQHVLSPKFLEKCRFYSPTYLCVRNLLLQYSPYKFHWNKNINHCHFSIFGFDGLGQTLLTELLKQVHYENNRKILINIFCKNADKAAQEFYALNPILNGESKIRAYVWGNFKISFIELPQNTADLLHNMPQLFDSLNENYSSQIFFCQKDLVNSQLAETLLPSLNIVKEKKKVALEVFIYTSASSEIVQNTLEKHFNLLIPSVNVVCFTDTPSLAAIKDSKLDELAMRINSIYDSRIKNDGDMRKYWHETIEKNKNSSRQAADHLWTKIKILGPELDWNFDKQDEYFTKWPEKLKALGDIEHRRWCAELLLRGHRPITEDINSSQYKEISENWDEPEYATTKKDFIKTFQHIDLVPYEDLYSVEAEKDLTQIKAIPNLLRKLKLP